ncbi:hypothetical protein [Stappia sp. TSB10P1A]|uniref:hypothetical protein n=1 Tax=Stappia sp. TSB10P1A TaxID=2003585 RepID=UPI001643A40F|nr:hypothetical protein [Stappia sp. TSB10P1A]
MDVTALSYTASAVLIWLPEGQEPKAEDFAVDGAEKLSPPYPNPETWWELGQAVKYAREADSANHMKLPWIKTGDELLSPDDVLQAYEFLKEKK